MFYICSVRRQNIHPDNLKDKNFHNCLLFQSNFFLSLLALIENNIKKLKTIMEQLPPTPYYLQETSSSFHYRPEK